MNLLDHVTGHVTVRYMQYLLGGLHQTDVALQFCDVSAVGFVPPLCDCSLFVVTALLYITVAYELMGYRANGTNTTT